MLIHLIAAARPNFMKVAPLFHALRKEDWAEPKIVHTGQHYDLNMSDAFFKDLGLPEPDIHLGVGSGSHAEQTGKVMIAYEKILMEKRPALIVVVGDVNSTVACTIAASKVNYQNSNQQPTAHNSQPATHNSLCHRPVIAHLEAGLRSFDRTMPEEINRIITDSLADILWTPSPDGDANLVREGISKHKINRVGNIMIDSLEMLRDGIEKQEVYRELNLSKGKYGLITLHRPSNVDDPQVLTKLCNLFIGISERLELVFPVHPRTRKNLENLNLMSQLNSVANIRILEPQAYMAFMNLLFNCGGVITDSGGIQEETTYLGIPCLTLRPNTERPVTVEKGTNRLCSVENLEKEVEWIISKNSNKKPSIELWDGKTASRVVESIKACFPGVAVAKAIL